MGKLVDVDIRTATGVQREKARRLGVRMVEMKVIRKVLCLDFSNHLYISFDMSPLAPALAPGVSHHEPGGLSTRQVIDIFHSLKAKIVGADIVELNPGRDPSCITAAAAVKIIKEIVGKIVILRKTMNKEAS